MPNPHLKRPKTTEGDTTIAMRVCGLSLCVHPAQQEKSQRSPPTRGTQDWQLTLRAAHQRGACEGECQGGSSRERAGGRKGARERRARHTHTERATAHGRFLKKCSGTRSGSGANISRSGEGECGRGKGGCACTGSSVYHCVTRGSLGKEGKIALASSPPPRCFPPSISVSPCNTV